MKNPHLSDFLFWKGKLAQVVGLCDRPTVVIQMCDNKKCPNCGHDLGVDQANYVIESPLFQENAKPVKTIEEV